MLDNGAYSAWTAGQTLDTDYWSRYWDWAQPVLELVDNALAIIPDVIDGDPSSNLHLIQEALEYIPNAEHRLIPVWHLHEDLQHLEVIARLGFRWIAFGSSGHFTNPGSPEWDRRVDQAFNTLYAISEEQDDLLPRVHLLRGLSQLPRRRHPFTSADSTNIARNHVRQARRGEAIADFRKRLEAHRFISAPSAVWPLKVLRDSTPPPIPTQSPAYS